MDAQSHSRRGRLPIALRRSELAVLERVRDRGLQCRRDVRIYELRLTYLVDDHGHVDRRLVKRARRSLYVGEAQHLRRARKRPIGRGARVGWRARLCERAARICQPQAYSKPHCACAARADRQRCSR